MAWVYYPSSLPPSLPQPCPTTEDGMYPLAELSLSTKVLLFLNPLKTMGGILSSVQINTAPLSLTLMQEGGTIKQQIYRSLVKERPPPTGYSLGSTLTGCSFTRLKYSSLASTDILRAY